MSRIGKAPVSIPEGVSVAIADGEVRVRGPRGELVFSPPPEVEVACSDGEITVAPRSGTKRARQCGACRGRESQYRDRGDAGVRACTEYHGRWLSRADGWQQPEARAWFSHDVVFEPPAGVTIETPRRSRSGSAESMPSQLARRPQTSAPSGRRSLTRARVWPFGASRSIARRRARRRAGDNHGHQGGTVYTAARACAEPNQTSVRRSMPARGLLFVQERFCAVN